MVVARVILKGSLSYRLGGRRFIKDVPAIIKGDEVKLFQNNGFFHVAVLKGEEKRAVDFDDDEDEAPASKAKAEATTKASVKSKAATGSGLKKRV